MDFFDLAKFHRIKSQNEKTEKKTNVYDTASELYNMLLEIYTMIYWLLRGKMDPEYGHTNLALT